MRHPLKIRTALVVLALLAGFSQAEASTTYVYRQFMAGNPVSCAASGSRTFATPGVYSVTVPSGCNIAVSLAGAGGGNAYDNEGGGPGGLVSFDIHPNSTQLTVVVGRAGSVAYPDVQYSGGTGGGYSLVAIGSTILGVAGGGGGAGGDGDSPAYSQGGAGGDPGTNGALAAYDYYGCIDNGTGGTETEVGVNGDICTNVNTGESTPTTADSAALESGSFTSESGESSVYEGDNGNGGNGGGGGGYYGGGTGTPGGGYGEGGGGGGGSSYVISSATHSNESTGEGSPAGENGAVTLSW